jgi:cysteine desulfurase
MTAPPVYLDHAATTPVRPEVSEAMLAAMERAWANPSSTHTPGRTARATLEEARERLAAVIGAAAGEIVFTRAGTEADNLAVLGRARGRRGSPVVCSAVEHRAVLGAARAAEAEGHPLVVLPVDAQGVISLAALDAALGGEPAVVSVMWASNETGVLQPVAEIAARCAAAGVAFHADAVQALGKVRVRVDEMAAGLLAFSAHKLGGPKGIGALFVRRGTTLVPLIHGGGQQRGLRPGTEDVAGAVGFAVAAELAEGEREAFAARTAALRARLETGLRGHAPELVVNGGRAERLPNVCNVSVPGADAEMLLIGLDREGISVSSGSACASGAVEPSHVLLAMGLPTEVAGPAVRFSLGHETGEAEVNRAVEAFGRVVTRVRG